MKDDDPRHPRTIVSTFSTSNGAACCTGHRPPAEGHLGVLDESGRVEKRDISRVVIVP
jgi:hypothetical protein